MSMKKSNYQISLEEDIPGTVVQSGANTQTSAPITITAEKGVKAVYITETEIDVDPPEPAAGANALSSVFAAVTIGKTAPTRVDCYEKGAVHSVRRDMYTAGAGVPACMDTVGPANKRKTTQVPRDKDGAYYYNITCHSSQCTTVRNAHCMVKVRIVR
jgi:hypothetical protein